MVMPKFVEECFLIHISQSPKADTFLARLIYCMDCLLAYIREQMYCFDVVLELCR